MSYLHDININIYIMVLSKIYTLFVVFCCCIILYISFFVIINYFDSSKLIYLNMYSIYYFCFLLTLILALIFNYYINSDDDIKIPGLNMTNESSVQGIPNSTLSQPIPVLNPAQIPDAEVSQTISS